MAISSTHNRKISVNRSGHYLTGMNAVKKERKKEIKWNIPDEGGREKKKKRHARLRSKQ